MPPLTSSWLKETSISAEVPTPLPASSVPRPRTTSAWPPRLVSASQRQSTGSGVKMQPPASGAVQRA